MDNIKTEEKMSNVVEEKMSNVVVIDFMAEWCSPCKMQDPVIEDMKKKFDGKVEFKKIDIDKDSKLADKYKIMAVPTLVIEKDGKILETIVGLTGSKELENKINNALK